MRQRTYTMPDSQIMGYGQVGENAEQEIVDEMIAKIDQLPTYEEVDAKLNEFYELDDMEGEEAYMREIGQICIDLWYDYILMPTHLQPFVANLQKLMDLEWLWSRMLLISDIKSDAPTPIASVSTKDFIELNLYDYNGNVNTNWSSDKDWPGFQWNGGAYDSGDTYSRKKIDFIDFGNSMITDYSYAGSGNGKATTAKNVGNQGGNINKIVEYPAGDWANKPVGMSTGIEVLGRTLTTAGYPWVTNAGSMVCQL